MQADRPNADVALALGQPPLHLEGLCSVRQGGKILLRGQVTLQTLPTTSAGVSKEKCYFLALET